MATRVDITLNENNDENISVAVTTNQPAPDTVLDITGYTVEAFLKPSAATDDGHASVWMGSTATGEVTITDGPAGECEVAIPAAAVTTTKTWWRVDVIDNVDVLRKTAVYGTATVRDL